MDVLSTKTLSYNAIWHSSFISFWLFLWESSQSHRQFWHGIILNVFIHIPWEGTQSQETWSRQAGSACQQKPILPTDFQQSQCNQRKGLSWARSISHPLQLISAGNRKKDCYLSQSVCHLWPVSVRKILMKDTLAHLKCSVLLVTTLAFLAWQ